MTRRSRWRAVASWHPAPGLPPVVAGRCYRATRAGLDRFVREHEAAGCTVRVWEVLPLPRLGKNLDGAATAPSPPVPSSP